MCQLLLAAFSDLINFDWVMNRMTKVHLLFAWKYESNKVLTAIDRLAFGLKGAPITKKIFFLTNLTVDYIYFSKNG